MVVNEVELQQYRHYIKDYDYFKQKNMERKHAGYLKKKKKDKNV